VTGRRELNNLGGGDGYICSVNTGLKVVKKRSKNRFLSYVNLTEKKERREGRGLPWEAFEGRRELQAM
jgi:hypothetical protein